MIAFYLCFSKTAAVKVRQKLQSIKKLQVGSCSDATIRVESAD